ncbi:MAG TPA: hypothetical protein VLX60_03715 [Terriglobales bacterium]|nr:hypothetical protein [Terriglobales bacterium]
MAISLPETQPWDQVSRWAGISWLVAYALFLVHALKDTSGFLFPDFVNLMIHEAGHLLFSLGGHTLMLLGGTLGELLVPLLCGCYFFFHGQTLGFAFSSFWFFENFLYIGTYMKDARANALPLVNSEIGDWTILFGQWGMLDSDIKIGDFVRALGWAGMIVTLGWLAWRTFQDARPKPHALELSP